MGLRLNIVILSVLLNYYIAWVFFLPKTPRDSPLHAYFPDPKLSPWIPFLLSTFSVCTITTYFVWGIYAYCQSRRARKKSQEYRMKLRQSLAPTPKPETNDSDAITAETLPAPSIEITAESTEKTPAESEPPALEPDAADAETAETTTKDE